MIGSYGWGAMPNPGRKAPSTETEALPETLRELAHSWMEEARRQSAEDEAEIEAWKKNHQGSARQDGGESGGFFNLLGDSGGGDGGD